MFAYISKYVWITEMYQILTITQDMQYIQTINFYDCWNLSWIQFRQLWHA